MSLPSTWTETLALLAAAIDGSPDDAQEWVRSAVEARWGIQSLRDLDRVHRQLAFQKTIGAAYALEEAGVPERLGAWLLYRDGTLEPAGGYPGRRALIAARFARYFDGVAPEGPPWQVEDGEDGYPARAELAAAADFAAV